MAIFFANANLATPRLDRDTVEAVLNGTLHWPHAHGKGAFNGTSVPLSLLEKHGLVTFYAGWCTVQCQTVRHTENLDSSLLPLFEALEHLKDICFGRDGYIQPHLACSEAQLDPLVALQLSSIIGKDDDASPYLRKENGNYLVTANSKFFDSLVSTYLWQKLRASAEPEEAFQHWIMCVCVNACWDGTILLFDYLEYEERGKFTEQLLAFLSKDLALTHSLDTLWKQHVAAVSFAHNISTAGGIDIKVDAQTAKISQEMTSTIPKITLANLADVFPAYKKEESELLTAREWYHIHQQFREPGLFYTGMIGSVLDAHIRIDGELLASYVGIEELFELAAPRPILKHILLHILPSHRRPTLLIWLLSRPRTCDIALFHLSIHSPIYRGREEKSFARNMDKAYQELVCKEYLRTLFDERSDSEIAAPTAERLLNILSLLAARCGLDANDFSNSFEYQFLICLLDELPDEHIVQVAHVFVQSLGLNVEWWRDRSQGKGWYLLAFWLLESLDRTATESLSSTLIDQIVKVYTDEFQGNFSGQRTLQPNAFFASLPWHRLLRSDGTFPLLLLSNDCDQWQVTLNSSNANSFAASSAVRHYLLVLMSVGRPQRVPNDWHRIACRVSEIVRAVGFAKGKDSTNLFYEPLYGDTYDLWSQFCSYTNLFSDQLFNDLVERLCPYVPLDLLFMLLEHCTITRRAEQVQEQIISRSPDAERLGLTGFEQAFLSACHSGHSVIAENVLVAAKKFMAQDRFAGAAHPIIVGKRKLWETYEYKLELIKLHEAHKGQPDDFRQAAVEVESPHPYHAKMSHEEREQHKECDRFRRYIIAAAYSDMDPEKCIAIMEKLCIEVRSNQYEFLLFSARSAKATKNGSVAHQKHALAQFLHSMEKIEPDDMALAWVAAILDAYRVVRKDAEIDAFWGQLSPDQQTRPEILRPFCRSLVDRGEPLRAQQIVLQYTELNPHGVTSDVEKLLDEIAKAVPDKQSMSQLVRTIAEQSQRSVLQLKKHYSDIKASNLRDYVAIVGQGTDVQEFLRDAVLEVANELLLRRKNLQLISEGKSKKLSTVLVEENLINDWFTSLFEHRMAHAGLSFRDQKRAGQSGSGENVGEVDGYITHSNTRVAIYEAFKLTSLETTVIKKHLNKMASYDFEALNPIFIAAYCNVSDFPLLTRKYSEFIASEEYVGFTGSSAGNKAVETLKDGDFLWLGMERRLRNHEEIVIYHLLLNMGC
ncbi:hypothetical protein [Duganella sp. HH105]|uniref:hypothetical protein n=1 Tax=Duganella sp. HH105 TaxID=1781067 RepID=UPI00114CD5AF|nr:hypothetical protein [Duganella sp. HH105]